MSRLEVRCSDRLTGGFELDVAFLSEARVTALFGPSGCGKTSVLETIAGLRRPASARVVVAGRVLEDSAAEVRVPPERRRVGMVFQDHLLFPHRSVRGNLRFAERRARRDHALSGFDRVVDVLELRPLLGRRPGALSGGERQRVGLARALLSHPDLLLLDEPVGALDESLRSRVLHYLGLILREWAIPVLFVSHAQAEVRLLADEAVVMESGRVVAQGPPEDALGRPEALGWSGQAGPMNLLEVTGVHEVGGQVLGRLNGATIQLPPPAGEAHSVAHVAVAPGSIVLTTSPQTGISARNRVPGRVDRLVRLPRRIFARVDAGQQLWVEVTPQAVEELALAPGREVTCLIKTSSLVYMD
jgi:molybdate transport system ATP-binding protein